MTDLRHANRQHILHVLGSLNPGGIETWLLQVLQHIDRDQFQLDFCCLSGEPGQFAPQVEALGSRIYPYRLTRNLLRFNREFARIVVERPYTVVHSHVHHFSGYILWRAKRAGITTRIAHSFTAPVMTRVPLQRRAYLAAMNWMIQRYATAGLGNSKESLQSLFGDHWQNDSRWQLMYLGIDLEPFVQTSGQAMVRQKYGLPDEALIIGHVGRLTPAKNQRFLIDVAAELESQCDNSWFVMVGDGPLRTELRNYAQYRRVKRLVMTGSVPETPSWYGLMDLFVFPSLWEGMPQAVVEAQAAGLRCLCADTITPEVSIVPGAVHYMSLDNGPVAWAAACLELLQHPRLNRHQAVATISASAFAIKHSVTKLSRLYSTSQTE